MKLNEMAYTQSEAIDKCAELGQKFAEHFYETYSNGIEDADFSHHCREMQAWYDRVSSIKLKKNNRFIAIDELIDWFFTFGERIYDVFDDNEVNSAYEKFIRHLIRTDNVKIAMTKTIEEV